MPSSPGGPNVSGGPFLTMLQTACGHRPNSDFFSSVKNTLARSFQMGVQVDTFSPFSHLLLHLHPPIHDHCEEVSFKGCTIVRPYQVKLQEVIVYWV